MTTTPRQFPFVYLVELFSPSPMAIAGEPSDDAGPVAPVVEDSDVCAKLELAIEQAYQHVRNLNLKAHLEVSFDEDNLIEGVGVFDADENLLACITVYHLDRDCEEASLSSIRDACRGEPRSMQAELNRIFQN